MSGPPRPTLSGALSSTGRAYLGGSGCDEQRTGDIRRAGGVELARIPSAAVARGRVVISAGESDVLYPDLTLPVHAGLILGIAGQDAPAGSPLSIVAMGELRDPSWDWSPGPVYCGAGGVLVQDQPSGGWVRQVAWAIAPDRLFVSLETSAAVDASAVGLSPAASAALSALGIAATDADSAIIALAGLVASLGATAPPSAPALRLASGGSLRLAGGGRLKLASSTAQPAPAPALRLASGGNLRLASGGRLTLAA